MNNIRIFLAIMTLLIFSCDGESNNNKVTIDKPEIYVSDLATSFKKMLFNKVDQESEINSNVALQSIIEQYENSQSDTTSVENPIDIYVIYDTDVWDEFDEKETFQITFAHQAIENEVLYEYRVTLIYEPKRFASINEFELRYAKNKNNLEDFKISVRNSPGFKQSLQLTPIKIDVIKEEI